MSDMQKYTKEEIERSPEYWKFVASIGDVAIFALGLLVGLTMQKLK